MSLSQRNKLIPLGGTLTVTATRAYCWPTFPTRSKSLANGVKRRNLPTPIGTSATIAASACVASAQTSTMVPTRKRPMVADNAASAAAGK